MQFAENHHPIIFPGKHLEDWAHWFENHSFTSVFVLVDSETSEHCLPLVAHLPGFNQAITLKMPSGERYKNLETAKNIWEELLLHGADRKSLLIGLGGGVVTDMAGFIGSTFKRGISTLHFPTSLMGMVDASIGGKTGVDLNSAKNQIGTFYQPEGVFVYSKFLETLPDLEIQSGFAEMLKYGFVGNPNFLKTLENHKDFKVREEDLVFSAHFKKKIVSQDPFEKGIRAILNFGHTAGHALEAFYLDHKMPTTHGFCVALGMMVALDLSKNIGLSDDEYEMGMRILNQKFPFPKFSEIDLPEIASYLKYDKKNESGKLKFVLLKSIGDPVWNHEISSAEVVNAMRRVWL